MIATAVLLSEQEYNTLHMIALQTGKSEDDLLRQAVKQLLTQFQLADRRPLLRQARGMWRERTDLPDWKSLRQEFDRTESLSL